MIPAAETRYRSRSFWLDSVEEALTPRAPLDRDLNVDVAIVGAGYTGLWTAYELLTREPTLRVAVLEAEIAGFGASGRNGGWCSALFAADRAALAKEHGRAAVIELLREMQHTVDEVGRVCTVEGIDAHFSKGGTLTLATAPTHVKRLADHLEHERAWGAGDADLRWLDAAETRERLDAPSALGSLFTPHCARVHPARLVRGLAEAVERYGGRICERTPVLAMSPRRLETPGGRVRADTIVRATEGYTAQLSGNARTLVPVYSLMIATEPQPASVIDALGWRERETFADGRHVIIYGQRTADDRIAFGGRGAPYHFGSRVRDGFDREPRVFDDLRRVLGELFPVLADVQITHQWGGPIGIPRDWTSAVGYDRRTGLAFAGGYVGDGVATTNLAGRTLADLILGEDTTRTRLPWVHHEWPSWEPEPWRWLGINAARWLAASADAHDTRAGHASRWREAVLARLVGD